MKLIKIKRHNDNYEWNNNDYRNKKRAKKYWRRKEKRDLQQLLAEEMIEATDCS